MTNDEARVALFVDVDNLCLSAQEAGLPFRLGHLVQRLRQEGRVMTARAYAHWAQWARYLPDFRTHGFELVELPSDARNKNTADVQLAVDALEMALSRVAPDIVAVVSGDRDFVPLVQKLKRYGVTVIGIAVGGTASANLQQCCDAFLFYENLIPTGDRAQQTGEDGGSGGLAPAVRLMARAVRSLELEGRPTVGAAVGNMMKRLDPTFDAGRYGVPLKELAKKAADLGYVRVIETDGPDFSLAAGPNAEESVEVDEPVQITYSYASSDEALSSYRTILQEKRIPIVPWKTRQHLVGRLWERLDGEEGQEGLTITEMIQFLRECVHEGDFVIQPAAIQKIVFTLNFSRCFTSDGERGRLVQMQQFSSLKLRGVEDVEGALNKMNVNYVTVMLLHEPGCRLLPEALASLLFDASGPSEIENAERVMVEAKQNSERIGGGP